MKKYLVPILLFFFIAGISQAQTTISQLPANIQTGFRQLSAKLKTGRVDYRTVESSLRASQVDFSKMSIEDAIMILFMLISEDAKKDLRATLDAMEETRLKRKAMREGEQKMKDEVDSLRDLARQSYGKDSIRMVKQIDQKLTIQKQYIDGSKAASLKYNKIEHERTAIEIRLRELNDEITRLRERMRKGN